MTATNHSERQQLSVHAGLNGVMYDSVSTVLVKYKKRRSVTMPARAAATGNHRERGPSRRVGAEEAENA